jgi:ketosteroid isomerase-like protein
MPGGATLYAKNGMVLPSNNDMVSGSQQIESFWRGMMNMGVKVFYFKSLDIDA